MIIQQSWRFTVRGLRGLIKYVWFYSDSTHNLSHPDSSLGLFGVVGRVERVSGLFVRALG